MRHMKDTIKKITAGALASVMMLSSMGSVNALALETKEWYLYYADSRNYTKLMTLPFQKYTNWNYTAEHMSRSDSSVNTLIQPGANTSLMQPSYVVGNSKITFKVTAAIGTTVNILAVLSYNTAPADTSGKVVRPNTPN